MPFMDNFKEILVRRKLVIGHSAVNVVQRRREVGNIGEAGIRRTLVQLGQLPAQGIHGGALLGVPGPLFEDVFGIHDDVQAFAEEQLHQTGRILALGWLGIGLRLGQQGLAREAVQPCQEIVRAIQRCLWVIVQLRQAAGQEFTGFANQSQYLLFCARASLTKCSSGVMTVAMGLMPAVLALPLRVCSARDRLSV
ncbi:MAG: hypothetical protein AWU57_2235 [Marinobacter sp. T13-3]|nr:MAG: hypothetical protein AWU57_2235 [Marinobacter sp. T13-3]